MYFTPDQFPAIFKSGLDKVLPLAAAKESSLVPKLLGNVISTKEEFYEVYSHAEMGLAQNMNVAGQVVYDSITPAYNKTYQPIMRQIGFECAIQSKYKDVYGVVGRYADMLAKSMVRTKNFVAANVLNDGFSGSGVLGPDGKTLFATDHPLLSGGTDSNRGDDSNNDMTLDGLNLETALERIMNQLDHRGLPWFGSGSMPKFNLIVNPVNYGLAKRVVESSGLQGTADNDKNAMGSLIAEVIPSPWIGWSGQYSGQTDTWFLVSADPSVHKLFMLNGIPLSSKEDFAIDNLAHKFVVYEEYIAGHMDWRGTWASNPS